jgi:hypothetical protein
MNSAFGFRLPASGSDFRCFAEIGGSLSQLTKSEADSLKPAEAESRKREASESRDTRKQTYAR